MEDNDVRTMQVIYFAQSLGASFFAGVVVYLSLKAFQRGVVPTPQQLQIVQILSFLLILLAVAAYTGAVILFKKIISKPIDSPTPQSLFARLRTALIVRIAFLEGAAFFGLVVLLLSGMFGVLSPHPLYWLTGLPYFILLVFIALNFPNKTRLQEMLNRSK